MQRIKAIADITPPLKSGAVSGVSRRCISPVQRVHEVATLKALPQQQWKCWYSLTINKQAPEKYRGGGDSHHG
jgi:hypothetical protein